MSVRELCGPPRGRGQELGEGAPSPEWGHSSLHIEKLAGLKGPGLVCSSGPAGGDPLVHGGAETGAQRLAMGASGGYGR